MLASQTGGRASHSVLGRLRGLAQTANVLPRTQGAVCFAAGKAFAKTNPGIAYEDEDAVWTPHVTRQGERPPGNP
jgi:hypothetical protein